MRVPVLPGLTAIVVGAIVLAGCADQNAVRRQAESTLQRLARSGAGDAAASRTDATYSIAEQTTCSAAQNGDARPAAAPTPTFYMAPRDAATARSPADVGAILAGAATLDLAADADALAAAEPVAPAVPQTAPAVDAPAEQPARAAPAATGKPAGEYPPLESKTVAEILKDDLRAAPGRLWNGTKLSYFNWPNFAILSLSFGADRIIRNNLDDRVMDHIERHRTSLHELGDTGEVLGHPGLHFGLAAAWYGWTVAAKDARNHELAMVLMEALAINDLTTGLLQASVHQHDPRGDYYGWPSGHASSSFCVASVLHEYYGWQVGVPAYLLAAYVGASRVDDRRHNLSDVWFGATIGLVVGHSVARGELPRVAGFTVLPYTRDDAAGLMLVRQW